MPLTGTPMTGREVLAAMTPGNAAAIPAAAMMTLMPRSLAPLANASTAWGVRWADRALTSKGIWLSSSHLQAFSITGRSLVLPMIILTNGFIFDGLNNREKSQNESHEKAREHLCKAVLAEDNAAGAHHSGDDEYHA